MIRSNRQRASWSASAALSAKRNGELLEIGSIHSGALGLGKMREGEPLLGSEIGIHSAAQFLKRTGHPVARGFHAAAPLVLAPLGIADARDSLLFRPVLSERAT